MKLYCDIISLPTVNIYTLTISNQTNHGILTYYDDVDKYLNNSDSYNDESDYRSDNYNNYKSNCKSNSEKAFCTSTNITMTLSFLLPNVQEQKSNVIYTLKQEKFNNDFTSEDLLNSI